MGERLGVSPDQDPAYELELLTGPEIDEHLLALCLQTATTLTISGTRILCIDNRTVNPETNIVTVTCRDEERHRHQLTYTLETDGPVIHEMLKDRPDPRTDFS